MPVRPLIPWLLLLASCAAAADPADAFTDRYRNALRDHDLAALNRLIAEDAAITVIWADATPARRFTLSKVEYLQQYRAVWRFGGRDSYEFSAPRQADGPDSNHRSLSLRITERRTLFGNPTGQRSDVEAQMRREGSDWKIDTLKAVVSLW